MPFISSSELCSRIKALYRKTWYLNSPSLKIKSSFQVCCHPTVRFKIRVIKFKFCCNSVILQPLPSFQAQLSHEKEKFGCYDNIALNQRYLKTYSSVLTTHSPEAQRIEKKKPRCIHCYIVPISNWPPPSIFQHIKLSYNWCTTFAAGLYRQRACVQLWSPRSCV